MEFDAALQLVRFYGRIKGVAEDKLDKTVLDLMTRLGLSEQDAMKPVGTYSGGMKRKPGDSFFLPALNFNSKLVLLQMFQKTDHHLSRGGVDCGRLWLEFDRFPSQYLSSEIVLPKWRIMCLAMFSNSMVGFDNYSVSIWMMSIKKNHHG